MSDRWEKRKHDKEIASIVKKAKQDMADWISMQDVAPSQNEMLAWQAGYLYGVNRGANTHDNNN